MGRPPIGVTTQAYRRHQGGRSAPQSWSEPQWSSTTVSVVLVGAVVVLAPMRELPSSVTQSSLAAMAGSGVHAKMAAAPMHATAKKRTEEPGVRPPRRPNQIAVTPALIAQAAATRSGTDTAPVTGRVKQGFITAGLTSQQDSPKREKKDHVVLLSNRQKRRKKYNNGHIRAEWIIQIDRNVTAEGNFSLPLPSAPLLGTAYALIRLQVQETEL